MDARGTERPEAASQPRWSSRAAPRGSSRTQLRASRAEVLGTAKHDFFSARLKTPFRENAPVKFYFPLQNHLPRCQELRPGEIKYPIILLGTEGRGGEGGTLTKPRSPVLVLSKQLLEPGEACEACGDVSLQLGVAHRACPRPSCVHAARAAS